MDNDFDTTAPTAGEAAITPGAEGAVTETPAEHKVFPPFDATTFASQLFWFAITFVIFYYPDEASWRCRASPASSPTARGASPAISMRPKR